MYWDAPVYALNIYFIFFIFLGGGVMMLATNKTYNYKIYNLCDKSDIAWLWPGLI